MSTQAHPYRVTLHLPNETISTEDLIAKAEMYARILHNTTSIGERDLALAKASEYASLANMRLLQERPNGVDWVSNAGPVEIQEAQVFKGPKNDG